MNEPTEADHECRHCSGLCAGRAAKCPYCKKWLRREAAELVGSQRTPTAPERLTSNA